MELVLKAGLGYLDNSRCTESPGDKGLCRPAGKRGFGHTPQPWLSENCQFRSQKIVSCDRGQEFRVAEKAPPQGRGVYFTAKPH